MSESESARPRQLTMAGWFVGQVMKATKGSADGGRAREILLQKLSG